MRTTAERDFKGVWIPKEVWLDERLSMLDKGIFAEIDSLDKGELGCFASNEHLAAFCQCSERKVSESVSKLIKLGYVQVASFDGRKRFLRSCVAKTANQTSKICEADSQNLLHSNTYRNPSNKPSNKSESVDYPDDFLAFWKAYPNGKSKRDALKAWNSLRPSEELQGVILADVAKKKTSEDWLKENGKYIPYPATYLRGRRWEDEVQDTVQDTVQDDTVGPFGAWRV